MGIEHALKLAGKFIVRGVVFKAGKKAALKGGKFGIGVASLISGGYMAYSLLEKRKKRLNEEKQNNSSGNNSEETIVV
ncbi:hypothetical protein [Christiangramia salexigens]|uniref:Uncharacterized protein n=1 Tax=Christiangramia salexigens TaxID=1913577 RepID=A0A1L3J7D8_9FLAO|nr:hypothetical protein [Christiangramia salexigens]APG61014.1 hypothetical protein LPB144_11615 [Christiangramia salexigens]